MHIQTPLIKTAALILGLAVAFSQLTAQSDQQLANFLKRNPEADRNGDGKLTREEANSYRRDSRNNAQSRGDGTADPTRGDNLATTSEIASIAIPESVSPIITVPLESDDGIDLSFAYRTPPGGGPFPAILFFHGGGGYSNLESMKKNLLNGAIHTRFLKAGYTIATATRRPYWQSRHNFESIGFFKAVDDAVLVVETAKTLSDFDHNNIVLYGGSGGAMLAIGAASKTDVACVVAGEPATVLLLAELDESRERPDYNAIMADPQHYYTGSFKKNARAMFKAINSPIHILHGDVHSLKKINFEIIIPELEALGKDISYTKFPGLNHGFYWGSTRAGATLHTVETIVRDVSNYIDTHTTIKRAK